MTIYDPIAESLGLTPSIDISQYPSSKELLEEHYNGAPISSWNKGIPHVEGQKESIRQRLSDGTHNFLNIEWRMKHARNRVENGSYSEISKRTARRQVENGTHPFLHYDVKKQQARLLNEGKHHSQKEHVCPHCGKIGRGNTMKKHHFDNCKSLQHGDAGNLRPVIVVST